jgi:hypothetical protein
VMKIASTIIAEGDRREQFVWGWLRLFLGFAQMSLAGLTLGALIAVGPTKLTILFAIAATAVTVVSRLIYRGQKRPAAR